MKKLLSLLLMVLMLLGGAAFAKENEEDTTPAVAPIVTFKSGFYVGYLDREIKITVSCKNKKQRNCAGEISGAAQPPRRSAGARRSGAIRATT